MTDPSMFADAAAHVGQMFGLSSPAPAIDTSSEPPLVPVQSAAPANDALAARATQSIVPQPPSAIAAQQPQIPAPQPRAPMPSPGMQVAQQQTSYEAPKRLSEEAKTKQSTADQLTESAVKSALAAQEAQAAAAKNEAAELNQRAISVEQQNAADAKELADLENEKAKRLAAVDAATMEYKKFSDDRKDGKRDFWSTKSTGEKVLMHIARALGAFGAALARTPNYAGDMIDKQIEQHIRQEETEERRLGKAVDLTQNGYAFLRQQGLDTRTAQLARKATLLDQSRAKVEAILATARAPEVLANGQKLLADFAQRRADVQRQIELDTQGKSVTVTQRMPTGGGISIEDAKKLQEMSNNDPNLKQWRTDRAATDRFRALVESKADGAAVMDFIATGMKQGSFTPTFVDMLKKRGYIDAAGEAIRSRFKGGYDPDLLKEMLGGLESVAAISEKRAMPAARQLINMGLKPSFVVGGQTEYDQAKSLGGVAK